MTTDAAFKTRLFSNDPAALREWNEAHAVKSAGTDPYDKLLDPHARDSLVKSGDMFSGENLRQIEAVEHFRGVGLNDDQIRQALAGEPVTRAEFAVVKLMRDQRMSDPIWTAKYLKGDLAAVREMTLANIVLSGGIEGEPTGF
jgi:hypothetical protein